MYCQKHYMRTLVIKQEEWAYLSDPTLLAWYWEPTQEPGDFHRTFALALCRTEYHDCEDRNCRNKFVVLVAIVRKPSHFTGIPFALVVAEFQETTKTTPTLLIVWLHCRSQLFPDIYYNRYQKHFTLMHDSQAHYNIGHPQKYVGALLQNAYKAMKRASPRAKLPPAYLDNPAISAFPVDSCVREP